MSDSIEKKGRDIGLLGGTFDPVHLGHMALAKSALSGSGLDEVWLMPNPIPPHKALKNNSASIDDRLEMLRLACEGMENILVSDFEIRSGRENYTYQTLEALKEAWPFDRFHFIIGADSLFMLETWKCPERLLPGNYFLTSIRDDHDEAAVRAKAEELNLRYSSHIELLKMEAVDISSTEVRRLAEKGESLSGLVPDKVAKYIRDNNLYKLIINSDLH